MQSRAWIKMLQRMPPEQHDSLSLTTTTGVEISIQTIFRLEEDYLVVRGRLSGTTDNGRLFFIPYEQINYVGILKEVKETEIGMILGETPRLAPSVQRILDTPSPSQTKQEPAPVPVSVPAAPVAAVANPTSAQAKPGDRLAIPRRSGLIARLRARTTESPESPPRT